MKKIQNGTAWSARSFVSRLQRCSVAATCAMWTVGLLAQQPSEPVNINPIDGQAYYLINQLSGLQADLNAGSATPGSSILIDDRSFTSLTQRWAMTALPGGDWAISNLNSGLCLDSANAVSVGTTMTVENPCSPGIATQQWSFTAASNGYVTVRNQGTGLVLDVQSEASIAGTPLDQTAFSGTPTQSQQWLLRPVFFRGIDNALLEKQESLRVAGNIPWWQDAGQAGDVLQILKNHGINMVRLQPTSEPPYNTYTASSCAGNGCYAETDSVDIDLAKRAKQLGMSVELTLFYDGGSSNSIPGDWSSDTLTQLETDAYNYVKSEVEAYRAAGAMPDMVTIGNEVDTGFFGSLASPGSSFSGFASIEKSGMQAILDASSDPSLGTPLPPPLRCIHITPAWDLTNFFTLVNNNGIPYDAICQSFYPMYQVRPLTPAQAAATNPDNSPVEETTLIDAANALGKPIFIIEAGEHYENGFYANDPWYPATRDGQRQFFMDLDGVVQSLPNHLGMGIEDWDPAGVNIPNSSGSGYVNADGETNAIFKWDGLTLFDNADATGSTQIADPMYSALLPALDALGGELDPTLNYKLVNVASGQVLGTAGLPGNSGTALSTVADMDAERLDQQWTITSNDDGYFQIANRNVASGAAAEVLDNNDSGNTGSPVVVDTASTGDAGQEWNIVTAGNGTWTLVNKSSGMVLTAATASSGAIQQQPSATNADWITPASTSQQWKIIPVNITATTTPASLVFSAGTPTILTYGAALGTISLDVVDNTGSLVLTSGESITLTVTGPNGYDQTQTSTTTNGVVSFDLGDIVPPAAGAYTLTASGTGVDSATESLTVTAVAPNFTIAAGESDVTLSSGSSANVDLTLTPTGGYTGTITMSCKSTLSSVGCSFNPATYTANGSNAALTGTITLTASSASAIVRPLFAPGHRSLLAAAALFFPGLLLFSVRARRGPRARLTQTLLLLALLSGSTFAISACGGNSGGGGSTHMQTGTVTLEASGSTGGVSQSLTLQITLQ